MSAFPALPSVAGRSPISTPLPSSASRTRTFTPQLTALPTGEKLLAPQDFTPEKSLGVPTRHLAQSQFFTVYSRHSSEPRTVASNKNMTNPSLLSRNCDGSRSQQQIESHAELAQKFVPEEKESVMFPLYGSSQERTKKQVTSLAGSLEIALTQLHHTQVSN